jgi:transcription elongation factor Elf1
MKIKLSATFEGKCNICGNEKIVFTAGDEDTKKAVTVCKDCADHLGDMKLSEAIEKYGKIDEESFKDGLSVQSTGKSS